MKHFGYCILSRLHFSQSVMPALYKEPKSKVVQTIREADSMSITTDGWISRATQSYLMITAHVITSKWEMASFAFCEVLTSTVERANHDVAVVRNTDVVVIEARLASHIKCFAYAWKLATQGGLRIPCVSCLLGQVRQVAAFFHWSSTATAVFASKQTVLELPLHKLVIDVATQWTSSLGMIDCYFEQSRK